MILHIITHGQHTKAGNDTKHYDGPLTETGLAKVSKIVVPKHDVAFRGAMIRHMETAKALNVEAHPTRRCGWDEDMFSVLEGNQEPVDAFIDWLEKLKGEKYKEVLIISSRMHPLLIKYIQGGGKGKFGPFAQFCKTIEAVAEWEGVHLPLMEGGKLWTFEV